jgi:acetyltransferase
MVDLPKEREIAIAGGERLLVRPVRRQDETALAEMLGRASPEDIRFRCFGAVKDFPHVLASRLVGIDPKQEATLVALAEDTGELMGVVHIICERLHPNIAEYSIMVRSDHQGHSDFIVDSSCPMLRQLSGLRDIVRLDVTSLQIRPNFPFFG